jgi:hypothetical protein
VEDNEDLETGKDLIDIINDWAKKRGHFKKGSNINPVYADKLSKEQEKKAKEEQEKAKAEEEKAKAEEAAKEKEDPEDENEDKK